MLLYTKIECLPILPQNIVANIKLCPFFLQTCTRLRGFDFELPSLLI